MVIVFMHTLIRMYVGAYMCVACTSGIQHPFGNSTDSLRCIYVPLSARFKPFGAFLIDRDF